MALLFDGNAESIQRGQAYYSRLQDTFIVPPTLVSAWIERETINALIADHGYGGEVDLLSLDLDGVDYWIWEAITCISPRVVVLEFQSMFPADMAVTVAYRRDFVRQWTDNYFGASLAAFVKLGRAEVYRLVGVNTLEFNAFFVRIGVGEAVLPEVSAEAILASPRMRQLAARHANELKQALRHDRITV